MTRALARLVVVLAALIVVAPAMAHEIGKTQVTAVFPTDRTYQVDVTVDPDALLTKLQVFGGEPISASADRADRDRRIAALASVFLEHMTIRFDGAPAS